MKSNRLVFIPFSGLLAGILLLVVAACTKPAESLPTATPLPTTAALAKPTYVVERGDVVETMELTGRIVPVLEKELYFPINGRLRNLYVDDGDQVAAGQIIADLEGLDDLERQQALRTLTLQRAIINAEIAALNLDIFTQTVSSYSRAYNEQLGIRERNVLLADLAVTEASLGLEDLNSVISDTVLLAPMDGVITSMTASEGREVESYKPIGLVADLSEMEVRATIMSQDLAKLAAGMDVIILPASGSGGETSGTIRSLPVGGYSENDEGMRVILASDAGDLGYKIGDLVHLLIVLAGNEDTLWLPPQAIRTFEGRKFVVVQDGDVQRRVDVKLGLIGEDRVEILEGLQAGDVVVSP